MKKKKKILTLLSLALAILSLFIGYNVIIYAKPTDIDPSVFEYSTNSIVGAWYDERSDCYVLQTLEKKRSSDNYYRTFIQEFSRIKSDVNPTDSIYLTDKEATMGENDPHYYVEVSSDENYAKELNGKYYDREYISYFKDYSVFDERYPTIDGVSYVYGTYVIDKEEVLAGIRMNYPEWYNELMEKQAKGEAAWIGLDSVICVHYPSLPNANYTIPGTSGRWTGLVDIKNFKTFGVAGEYFRWSNWEDLGQYFTENNLGSLESGKGIYTHFNTYLNITTDIQDPGPIPGMPPPSTDDSSTEIEIVPEDVPEEDIDIIKDFTPSNVEKIIGYNGSYNTLAAPSVYTYNTSDEFDLGIAIPSTESYTNGIEVSSWYGSAKITKHNVSIEQQVPYIVIVSKQGTEIKEVLVRSTTTHPSGEYDGLHYPEEYESYDGKYYTYRCWFEADDNEIVYYEGVYTYMDETSYYAVEEVNLFAHDSTSVNNEFSTTEYNEKVSVPYNITINGENVNSDAQTSFSSNNFVADTSYHVSVPDVLTGLTIATRTNEEIRNTDEARAFVQELVNEKIGDAKLSATNDYLSIDGVTYLDQDGLHSDYSEEGVSVETESGTQTIIDKKHYIEVTEEDTLKREQTVTIPAETQNGDYYTSLRVNYRNFAAGNTLAMIRYNGNSEGMPGIKEEYKHNEPIRVHTPVISPISIQGEDKTQLVESVQSYETQLILDNTYTVTFDWATYFHYKGYTADNFANYVMSKEVSFPFDVIVNGVYYNASESSGRTAWIDVGNVESFDFYIPSWAEEGIYGSDEFKDYEYYSLEGIEARVYAVNYIDDEEEKWEEVANTNKGNYMATYSYPVQVSGVIYDFQVTSINDALLYGGDEEAELYNFVTNGQDKNSGPFNRFGETALRFTKDGTIADPWDSKHLLPLTAGSSLIYEDSGVLIGGHTIGFTVKTISNLYGKNDTVEITPNYRYITPEGDEIDVNVYFVLGNSSYTNIYDDTYNRITYVGSPYFENCLYDYGEFNPITFTADYYDTSTTEILYRETESNNAGKIVLYSTQKLLTGNEEELTVNKDSNPSECLRYNDGLFDLNTETTTEFHASMQTWYGQYTIPTNLFICERYEDGTDAYQRAMEEDGYVSDTSDFWLNDGFLVLGFDIKTYKNGTTEDLTYIGGKLNMWQEENGGNTDKDAEITYHDPVKDEDITVNIPIKDGDVAIIDVDKKLSDKYSIGILYLN